MKNSIRTWLVAPLIGFCIVPLILLGSFLSWQNYIIEKENAKSIQKQITIMASDNISFFIHEQILKVTSLLRNNNLPALSPEIQRNIASIFINTSKCSEHAHIFDEISILDKNGKEFVRVSHTDFIQPCKLSDRSGIEEFIVPFTTGKTYFSPIYFKEKTGEPLIKMSKPVRDIRTLEIQGVLSITIRLKYLWQKVAEIRIGQKGVAFLTNYDGQVIAHPNRSVVLRGTQITVPEETSIIKGINGEKAVVAAERIPIGQQFMFLVTEVPASEAFKHINRSILIIESCLLFMLLGAIILGFIIVRRIVIPIESLAKTAKEISAGDFSKKTALARKDEIGDLATAFNTMTTRLVESIEAYKTQKDFVETTIESLTYPFYVIDANDYTITLANSAANFAIRSGNEKCYQLTHSNDHPCSGKEHPCTLTEVKKTKKPVVVEHVHYHDGTKKTYEIYGFPILDERGNVTQIIEYNIDISVRKNLEEQLLQTQKLEAIGILAGGVAHDFNNILTTILGYSELILLKLPKQDPLRKQIEAINASGVRAAELTGQLLAFSRKQVMELKIINLNSLINNMMKMLGRLIGENIILILHLHDSLGNIKGDPTHVEQIIMNLIVNAKDAMPDGGKLIIETDSILFDKEYCQVHPEVSPGEYVMLSVTDTGHGMSPAVKEKIFDPFFTTKEKGKGTGLGLSTVYGIIKQLKAHIFVYSEQGTGTTFKIFFPEAKEDEEKIVSEVKCKIQGGTETLLVVDDDASIRNMAIDTLQSFGYQVLSASSGEEAVEISKKWDKTIDLLITDVIMPGMSGKDLAETLKPVRQEMEVLFMSGYTDDLIADKGVINPDVFFINKPLVPSLLCRKIREILDK